MAVVAALADVEVTSSEFERGVELLHTLFDVFAFLGDHGGNDLSSTSDGGCKEYKDRERNPVFLKRLVKVGPLCRVFAEYPDGLNSEQDDDDQCSNIHAFGQEDPKEDKHEEPEDVGDGLVTEQESYHADGVGLCMASNRNFNAHLGGFTHTGRFEDVDAEHDKADEVEHSTKSAE